MRPPRPPRPYSAPVEIQAEMGYGELIRMKQDLERDLRMVERAMQRKSEVEPHERSVVSESQSLAESSSLPLLQFSATDRRSRPSSAPTKRVEVNTDRLRAAMRPLSAGAAAAPREELRRASSASSIRDDVPLLRDFQAFSARVDVASREVWHPHNVRAAAKLENGVLVFSFGGPKALEERARILAWMRSKAPSWKPLGLEPFPPVWNMATRGGVVLFALRPNWLPPTAPVPRSLQKVMRGAKPMRPELRITRPTSSSACKMQDCALFCDPDAKALIPPPPTTKKGYRCASIW